jgi:hypothetical protein
LPEEDLEKLRDVVRSTPRDSGIPLDKTKYLRAKSLQAQLYDHFGNSAGAREAIGGDGPRLEAALRRREKLKPSELWLLTYYSHCIYRDDYILDCRNLLKDVQRAVDELLPIDGPLGPHYDLRHRIAYSLGQTSRQLGNRVKQTRAEFLEALEFARKHLDYELNSGDAHRKKIALARAHYQVGKVFCFGLSWAAMQSGEVGRARGAAAAGSMLLSGTGDRLHAAYARVIYAEALRETARPARGTASPQLEDVLEILRPLVDAEKSPLRHIARFFFRARYQYAASLHAAGRHTEAEQAARSLYNGKPDTRWHIHAGVLLSRILLSRREHDESAVSEAVQITQSLLSAPKIHETGSPLLRADVLLCRADVLMGARTVGFEAIHRALDEAEELSIESPLTNAQCHLFRARCFSQQRNLDAAWREFAAWEALERAVEHEWVKELADQIRAEIRRVDTRFVALESKLHSDRFDKVEGDLRRWALDQLFARYGREYLKDENTKSYLGKSSGAVRQWVKELNWAPPVGGGAASDL